MNARDFRFCLRWLSLFTCAIVATGAYAQSWQPTRPVALIVAAVLQTAVPIAIFGAKRFRTLRSIEQAVALDARRA